MSKRSREELEDQLQHEYLPLSKRSRKDQEKADLPDRLSSLSSELLLHILSFLPISSLNICQRLSHRFYLLAGDSELWKRQYYTRWVKPRARRLANATGRRFANVLPPRKVKYSPRVSTWLGHGHLAEEGRVSHWKTQYRLKHNWSKGICRLTEVELSEPPQPPFLSKLCFGFMFTVDAAYGLRVCRAKRPTCCVARADIDSTMPTALTAAYGPAPHSVEVTVGFQDGHFRVYYFDVKGLCLKMRHVHRCDSADGAVTCMASSPPYLLMVSQYHTLSLYEMPPDHDDSSTEQAPRILASLKAESMVAPMTLSVRVGAGEIISSIVYSFFHLGCGWSLGIQELRFGRDGQPIGSRLTTTVDCQYGSTRKHQVSSLLPAGPCILHRQPPTSMSYAHPYLLTSHADNTLTMYLVVSSGEELFVKSGRRLWGHTSSISTVQVSDRGRAVSVSSYGDEMRVWELETAMVDENSIQVTPENRKGKKMLAATGDRVEEEEMRGCVGFDEERVMLFRGKRQERGSPWLECYDFT